MRLILAAAVVSILAAPARADVVFDTFGPGDSFAAGSTSAVTTTQSVGARFMPSADITLMSIEVALRNFLGAADILVELRADDLGSPGAVLDSSNPTGWADGVVDVAMTGGVFLDSTSHYWVTLRTLVDSQGWSFTQPSVAGTRAISNDQGATWFAFVGLQTTAFRVNGAAAVPEPSSLVLVVFGILGAIAIRRRF